MRDLSRKEQALGKKFREAKRLYGILPEQKVREVRRSIKKSMSKASRREDQRVLQRELEKV